MKILVFGLLLVTLLVSLFIALSSQARQNSIAERFPWVMPVGVLISLYVLGLVAMQFGAISRGETSALPWAAYRQEALRHGAGSGAFAFITTLIYNLWAFWIPGHLFANHKKERQGNRPTYPYVINGLTGLLLSIENSPLFHLLDKLAP